MTEDPGSETQVKQSSTSKKAPIVDNFLLLFYDQDEDENEELTRPEDEGANEPAEVSFRESIRNHTNRIEDLRKQITDKYHAKQLIQMKLDGLMVEIQNQARYNAINLQTTNAIKVNYQRMRILCEKIYSISMQLQTTYISLADIVDKRVEHTMEMHRLSRLCTSMLHDFNKQETNIEEPSDCTFDTEESRAQGAQ